jgi:flagellar protein FliJ
MAGSKGLKTLIRLAGFNVDEKRRVLVALQTREDEILAAIAAEERQLAEEQRIASEDSTGVGFLYGAYANAWLDRRGKYQTMLAAVRAEIEKARDDLAEAFREQKTYELTQTNREKRAKEEADQKEQAFLDEIGLNLYRRKGKDEG